MLAVFPVLYSISLQLIYFIPSSLYLLIPHPYLAPPHFPLPIGNHEVTFLLIEKSTPSYSQNKDLICSVVV